MIESGIRFMDAQLGTSALIYLYIFGAVFVLWQVWYYLTKLVARREFERCIRGHTIVKFVQPPRGAGGRFKKK